MFDPHKEKNCPKCGGLWDGGDIVETLSAHELYKGKTVEEIKEMAAMYGWSESDKKRFSNLIAVDTGNDRTEYYQCPHCNAAWDRFTGEERVFSPKS